MPTLLHYFPEEMLPEAEKLLVTVRSIYPQVTFWFDLHPVFPKPKPNEKPMVMALFAEDSIFDLTPVTAIFEVARERFIWRRHARELEALKSTLADRLYTSACERDRLLMRDT